jgi:hypothetical protein
MKKTTILLGIIIALNSCKKEESSPCNCGIIQSDNVQNYSVVIRNECTNNDKSFVLSQADWTTAYVGSRYCITNSGKW